MYIIISGSARQVGSEPGDRAPDFSLPSYSTGEDTALSDYHGNLIVLNMWASWCEPCVRELPALLDIHENYREEDVKVIYHEHEFLRTDTGRSRSVRRRIQSIPVSFRH
ncbi:peroxiredoxin family protein [Sinobaca sp. H24]|uniref:peroxiredoxin family protein n=1 Tax=Sinobaca sp. H24 TaxID=2923376 RepID=UPI0035B21393